MVNRSDVDWDVAQGGNHLTRSGVEVRVAVEKRNHAGVVAVALQPNEVADQITDTARHPGVVDTKAPCTCVPLERAFGLEIAIL